MSDDKQLPEKEREEAVNSNETDIPNNTGYERGGSFARKRHTGFPFRFRALADRNVVT